LNQLSDIFGDTDHLVSLALIDGRNIWKTDLVERLEQIQAAVEQIGDGRLMLAPSCFA